jgi:hypothetical protein
VAVPTAASSAHLDGTTVGRLEAMRQSLQADRKPVARRTRADPPASRPVPSRPALPAHTRRAESALQRWTGKALTAQDLGRLTLVESRVLAYLAWASAARRTVSLTDIAAVTGPGDRPIGVHDARRICEDLHDCGFVFMPQWLAAGTSGPMTVVVGGRPEPGARTAERNARSEVLRELEAIASAWADTFTSGTLDDKIRLAERKVTAQNGLLKLNPTPANRTALERADKMLGELHIQRRHREERQERARAHPAVSVACPLCTAASGAACLDEAGKVRTRPHRGRVQLHETGAYDTEAVQEAIARKAARQSPGADR